MEKQSETARAEAITASTFSKEQLLKSQRYHERRDLLNVLLQSDKRYSHDDVKTLIGEFMKGKVK